MKKGRVKEYLNVGMDTEKSEAARSFAKQTQNVHKSGAVWRAFLLVLLVCSIPLLSACGNKAASEAELQEDLYNSDAFSAYREKEFEITELIVTKRQTSEEDRSDKVWVKVELSNTKAEGYLFFVLDYSLYNDGWQMDTAQMDTEAEHTTKPLCGLSEEELYSAYLPSGAEILSNDVDLEDVLQEVTFSITEEYRFCSVNKTVNDIFQFDSENASWVLADSWEVSAFEHWKTGRYSLFDIQDGYVGNEVGELNISSLDTDSFGGTITYSYSTSFRGVEGSGDNLSLVNTKNMTITDYYDQGYGSFYHKYGYTEVLMNASWTDIEYAKPCYSEERAPLFIGYDHIYLGEHVNKYDERTDTKYVTFPFEAK